MKTKILLVDDHSIMRDGVRAILERGSDYEVIGEATNGLEALRICKEKEPDIVVMDVNLPGITGIEAAAEI